MDERTQRVGRNEALFRQVNEQINAVNASFGRVTRELAVVCECGDPQCVEQITLPLPDYEALRANPVYFVVKPGHQAADLERVVARHDDYWIIEKHPGEPTELAAQLDSRHP